MIRDHRYMLFILLILVFVVLSFVVAFAVGVQDTYAGGNVNMLIANTDPCEPGGSDHCDPADTAEGVDTITYNFEMSGTDDINSTYRLQFGTDILVDQNDAATDLTVVACGSTVVLENAPTIDNTSNSCTAATWDSGNNQVVWDEATSCTTGDIVTVTWDIRFCSGSSGSTFDFDLACTKQGGHANCNIIEYLDQWGVAAAAGPTDSLIQHAYKWFANVNSENVGGSSGINSPTTAPAQGKPFRLRLLLYNEGQSTISTSGTTTDLLIATRDSDGVCDGTESYAEVTQGSGDIRYYTGNTPADGTNLIQNPFDPTPTSSAVTVQPQDYEDANTFTNSVNAIAENEAGLWDFALVDFSAPAHTTYCFRAEQDDSGTNFVLSGGYEVYPEITTAAVMKTRLRGAIRLRLVRLR